jgi:hypothetical protein
VGLGRPPKLGKLRLDSAAWTRPRSVRYVKPALLALMAALGSLATYAFAGGSQAATMATLPRPDPAPTTRRVVPPPEPPPPATQTYVAPPPAQTYVAPAPAPPVTPTYTSPSSAPAQQSSKTTAPLRPPRKVHHRGARRHHAQTKNKRLPAVATPVRPVAPRELPRDAAVGVALLPAAAVGSEDATPLLRFAFWLMLGLSLVVLAVAAAPPRVLPATVGIVVGKRRESIIRVVAVTPLSIGVGVGIVLLGS